MENYFYRKLVFAKSKSSGTSNYADLSNKPQINGVTLDGNKTSEDLGIEQGVTEEVLTQALAAESAAREKQDDLLQGEIDTKMAPANIIAGNGVKVEQSGLDVTVSQDKIYTAGTNIEITEDGVINNTIPYRVFDNSSLVRFKGIAYGGRQDVETPEGSLLIGNTYGTSSGAFISNSCRDSVAIGQDVTIYNNGSSNNVVIGYDAGAGSSNNVVIGHVASADGNKGNSIVLGNNAKSTKANQFTLGSSTSPINEMKVVTSNGDKYIATTDQTVPAGGTAGQVLMKNSNTDYDFSWTSLANYDEVSF